MEVEPLTHKNITCDAGAGTRWRCHRHAVLAVGWQGKHGYWRHYYCQRHADEKIAKLEKTEQEGGKIKLSESFYQMWPWLRIKYSATTK